jgi:hypothetical protein
MPRRLITGLGLPIALFAILAQGLLAGVPRAASLRAWVGWPVSLCGDGGGSAPDRPHDVTCPVCPICVAPDAMGVPATGSGMAEPAQHDPEPLVVAHAGGIVPEWVAMGRPRAPPGLG